MEGFVILSHGHEDMADNDIRGVVGNGRAGSADGTPVNIRLGKTGEFVVAPGCAINLHATAAAGTTPLVVFGMVWEEIPV